MKQLSLILSLLLLNFISFGQTENNLLKIKGNASLYQIPEIMKVNIPLQVKDSIYENCSKQLAEIHQKLVTTLISNGIDKKWIKSDNLNIREKTKWTKKGYLPDGYFASIDVRIQMKHTFEKLNAIINTLKKNEFKFGYDVDFKLSEEQKAKLLESAIEHAIKDAKNKADIIAKNLNIQLLQIKEINYGYSKGDYDILTPNYETAYCITADEEMEEDDDIELILDINPKKIGIKKSINIIWEIKQL